MKIKILAFWAAAAVAGLALGGCSTPASRIAANPAAFDQLTPQQQALVKQGQIAIGMSMDAVRLALGGPDRVTVRTTAQGQEQIWHYVQYEANGMMLYTGYYFHPGWYRHGLGWWGPRYPWYLDYPDRTVVDRIRVSFTNGEVTGITREQ